MRKELDADAHLHKSDSILRFTPPVGWIVLRRMASVEEAVLFGSTNYALPEDQRFPKPNEAKNYGYDPAKKSDADVAAETLKRVW